MLVDLFLVGRMDVIVSTMVARVIVVVYPGVSMIVPVLVLVPMLVSVGMRVLMGVSRVSVGVFVCVAVVVPVGMQMFVFVVTLHNELLSLRAAFAGKNSSLENSLRG
jgi:hypothetical protein